MAVTRSDKALSLFSSDFNCAQSVLASFAGDYGLEETNALKLACGFGGGIGHTARTCGAVTGAFMVTGLKYGKYTPEDKAVKPLTYGKVKEFIAEFEKRHDSIECKQLLGIDISSEKGLEEAREKGLFKTVCFKIVEDAVDILEKVIL
ncbi:MAG: C_GCAxxG_C_C family protein [Nitrospirae bacterium]|nr:C_GCAxxG_C_C family protein [Nitrospirota bacterium]